MDLRRCDNDHFYDAEKYKECPHCKIEPMRIDIEKETEDQQDNKKDTEDWKDTPKDTAEWEDNEINIDTGFDPENWLNSDFNEKTDSVIPDITEPSENIFGMKGWGYSPVGIVDCSEDYIGILSEYSTKTEDKILTTKFTEIKVFYDKAYVVQRGEFAGEQKRQTILIDDIKDLGDAPLHIRVSDGVRCCSQAIVMREKSQKEQEEMHLREKNSKILQNQKMSEKKRLLFNLQEQKRVLSDQEPTFDKLLYETKKEYFDKLLEEECESREKIQKLETEIHDMLWGTDNVIYETPKCALKLDLEVETGQQHFIEVSYLTEKLRWNPAYEWHIETKSDQSKMILAAEVNSSLYVNLENIKATFFTAKYDTWKSTHAHSFDDLIWTPTKSVKDRRGPFSGGGTFSSTPIMPTDPVSDTTDFLVKKEPVFNRLVSEGLNGYLDIPSAEESCQEYVVKGVTSIYENETCNRIFLSEQIYHVEKFFMVMPRRDESAYVSIRLLDSKMQYMQNTGISVFLDGYCVRKFESSFELSLTDYITIGRIDGIKVHRTVITDQQESRELYAERILREKVVITIENMQNEPISLRIMDQVPSAWKEDVKIRIEDLTQAELNAITGECSWNVTLDAGEKKEFMMKYMIMYPEKQKYI